MSDREKAAPGAIPPDETPLASKVGAANVSPEDPTQLVVRLDVEGGSGADRYELHLVGTGSGDVQLEVKDRLRQIEFSPRVGQARAEEVADVLKCIDIAQIIEFSGRIPPIPPDSVVGILRITDGKEEVSLPFMADEGQAENAGFELPEELREAIDAIFEISARQLDVESVRP